MSNATRPDTTTAHRRGKCGEPFPRSFVDLELTCDLTPGHDKSHEGDSREVSAVWEDTPDGPNVLLLQPRM